MKKAMTTMGKSMAAGQPDERSWHFKQLRRSLESLAACPSDQEPLFPDLVVTPDELALSFDHWSSVICQGYGSELTATERASLEAIEQTLTRMSRDAVEFDADIWTDNAVRTSADWTSLRQFAAAALDAFGWRAENPSGEPADQDTASGQPLDV